MGEHASAPRHRCLRQVDTYREVVAHGLLGPLEIAAGGVEAVGVHVAVRGGRALGPTHQVVARSLADAGGALRRGSDPAPLGEGALGLDGVAALATHLVASGRHRLLRGLLLGRDLGGVRRPAAAVPAQRAAAQVGDPVDPLEELAVVADDEQGARPGGHEVVDACATGPVEVVGGLVEQQDVGAGQEQAGDGQAGELTARELAQAAVQRARRQALPLELGAGALLDVPVVADSVEEVLVAPPGLDGAQGSEGRAHTEEVGDGPGRVGVEVLRQVADLAVDRDVAGVGALPPGQHPQQGRLARAVGPDQPGAAPREGQVEVAQRGGAVGPGDGEAGDGDDGMRRGHGCSR